MANQPKMTSLGRQTHNRGPGHKSDSRLDKTNVFIEKTLEVIGVMVVESDFKAKVSIVENE